MRTIGEAKDRRSEGDAAKRLLTAIAQLGRHVALRDPLATYVTEHDLTPPQIHTIIKLGHSESKCRMSDLAKRMCMTGATATGIIDRLERAGLVQRERSTEDRRVVFLSLTRKGQTAFTKLERAIAERIGHFMTLLEPKDRESLIAILEKLARRAAEKASNP